MKKNWYWFLCFICIGCVCLFPTETVKAETEYVYRFHEDEQAYYIVGVGGIPDEEIVLPTTYKGYPVVGLEANAFGQETNLKKVTIPKGYTELSSYAFAYCSNLEEMVILADIESIGELAFAYNPKLKEITLPVTVKNIDREAFRNSGFEEITIPKNVTSIGENAFEECTNLKKAIIKGKIKTLKKEIFLNCTSLETIVLPDSLKKIESYVFRNTVLKTFRLPESVTTIADYAFYDCGKLEKITIPKSVTSIGEYVFSGCANLEKVILKAKIKTLKSYTFIGCKKLETISLPSTLKTIKGNAFWGSGLKKITIPKNVTKIEGQAFAHLDNLKEVTIKAQIKTLDSYVFYGCDKLEKVVFPSTLKTIKEFAFMGTGFKTITIPKTIKKIESNAFASCDNLYRMIFEGDDIELQGYIALDNLSVKVTFVANKGSDAYYYAKEMGFPTTESKQFKVELNGTKMYVGEKKLLQTYNNPYPVKWSSSNKKVVTFDEEGYITAKKTGSATITGKINGKKYKYKIKVVKRTEKNVLDIIWKNYVTKDMSDYEKVVEANRWICQNVVSDYDNYINGTIPITSCTTKDVLKKGIAVCDGYANVFMKIIEHYGIPVKKVVGSANNNSGRGYEAHAWNLVKIGTRWYHVDVTWNDPVFQGWSPWNYVGTNYLLVSDSRIDNNHLWAKGYYPKASSKAPDTMVTTVNKNGTKISAIEKFLKVGKSTTLKVTGTKKKVTWSSSNKKIVTVNSKGKITAKKAGTAKIYCKIGGKKYSIKITVEK